MRPARGLLLVQPVETRETYAGSKIVVPEGARQRLAMWQAEVVAVGPPETCDDDDCERSHGVAFDYPAVMSDDAWLYGVKTTKMHPTHIKAGDWILVKPRSYIDTGDVSAPRWLVRQSDVLAIFREESAS